MSILTTDMHVILKVATSLDGRIATRTGDSQWITGPDARKSVHELRAGVDAVLVGIGTVLADDPALTVRLDSYTGKQPAAVVLDSRWQTPPDGRFVEDLTRRPVIIYGLDQNTDRREGLAQAGFTICVTSADDVGRVSLQAVLADLSQRGLQRIMIEGGGQIAASFLKAGLVDAVEWYRAPIILGGDGKPVFGSLGIDALSQSVRFIRTSVEVVGPDLLERYQIKE